MMAKKRLNLARFHLLALVSTLAVGLSVPLAFSTLSVDAAQLSDRSLYVANPLPSANTSHTFQFAYASPDPVGAVTFEYCTSPLADLPCDAPPGLDASNATLAQQSGETGYFMLNTQTNKITITRVQALIPAGGPSQYVFDNITNPGGTPETFYVRITTHQLTDATDPPLDFGAVANSTTRGVQVSTEVPPILKFCVGLVLANDCSTAEDALIDLGDLTPARVSTGTSQLLAATNADFGLSIAMYGSTMTSGNNIINALDNPTVSAPGNQQFGINLVDNSSPNIGQNPDGIGIINPTSRYGQVNKFAFISGDTIATSPDATDIRKLTASYIVNVPPSQPPGVYTATITYICTAAF